METDLGILRSVIDFGLCVLIWLVQLVIYPVLAYLSTESLHRWHARYTSRIAYIVLPLMGAQLGLVGWLTYADPSALRLTSLTAVLLCWLLTLFVSAPLHGRLARGEEREAVIARLITTNWPRTGLWTLIFLLGMAELLPSAR